MFGRLTVCGGMGLGSGLFGDALPRTYLQIPMDELELQLRLFLLPPPPLIQHMRTLT